MIIRQRQISKLMNRGLDLNQDERPADLVYYCC